MTTIRVLRVVAKREGFRRAGLVFGSQPQDVPLTALTDVQRAAITRDPMLLATQVEVEVMDEDQTEVPPEGARETGDGDATDAGPSVTAATAKPAAGRKRK